MNQTSISGRRYTCTMQEIKLAFGPITLLLEVGRSLGSETRPGPFDASLSSISLTCKCSLSQVAGAQFARCLRPLYAGRLLHACTTIDDAHVSGAHNVVKRSVERNVILVDWETSMHQHHWTDCIPFLGPGNEVFESKEYLEHQESYTCYLFYAYRSSSCTTTAMLRSVHSTSMFHANASNVRCPQHCIADIEQRHGNK